MRILISAAAVGGFALASASAFAQTQANAPPSTAPVTTIVYSDKGPNGLSDVPLGIHRVPDSHVIISGHQKGGIGILFGVVGMLAESSANAQTGTSKVRNVEDDLRFDVTAKASELTKTILDDEKYRQRFTLSSEPTGDALTVTPYVVLTFQGEGEIRPYVVLKTKPSAGAGGEPPKTIKYFCCEGKALPLTGENGLSENNGARLKAFLAAELDTAIHVMLADRAQPYPRNDNSKISVNGYLPFVGKPFKLKGYDLGRYKDYSLIEFRSGALVFGGVNIAEPDSLEITPVGKK